MMNNKDDITTLINQSGMVREKTVKKLYSVPEGFENWKVMETFMTVANLIQHLIDGDQWLFEQIRKPRLKFLGPNRENIYINNRDEYNHLIGQLRETGHQKTNLFKELATHSPDESSNPDFRNGFPQWCFFLRENIDHEVHHSAQLSIYLELIEKKYPGAKQQKR